jgi:tetratricopeptide (TPR) repeat protein
MWRRIGLIIGLVAVLTLVASIDTAFGQRGGGRGGGGGRAGGGGRSGGGGGGVSRGGGNSGGARTPNVNRSPSFSQPRPSNLPSNAGGARPGNASRPNVGGGVNPNIANRPSTGMQPGGVRPGSGRPEISQLPANRPAVGDRPAISDRPGAGSRPGIGNPGISTLPAIGAGAAIGSGIANRPGVGDRPTTLPGLGSGDRLPGRGERPTTLPARRDDLQSRLDGGRDWQNGRLDNLQNNRQDFLNNRREDWQNWSDRHDWYHDNWHHGNWHGNWGGWWDHLWNEHPLAAGLGLTWWGVNRLSSWYGFPWYYNPYYTVPAEPTVINYSEPLVLPYQEAASYYSASAPASTSGGTAALPPDVNQEALDKFDQARTAFSQGQYDQALKLTDEALAKMPKDAAIHEFRSLVLFALKRYPESAAAIHAVLAVGPGWDWTTLSSLYPSVDTYTAQLRALEAYCTEKPTAADGRFLLAYHYITMGHPNEATKQLQRAIEYQPKDAVAANLLQTISPTKAASDQAPAQAKTIPAEQVQGSWTASGPGNSQFMLTLAKDGAFTWGYNRGNSKQQVKGVYGLEQSTLAMEPDSDGILLADLVMKDVNTMHFQVVGAPKGDPGLEFKRDTETK